MAPDTGSARNKRARPQQDDESSARAQSTDTAASAKKRRLNGSAETSIEAPKGFSAITSAIGSMFGYKRSSNATATAPKSSTAATSKSAYDDVPDSDEETNLVPAQNSKTKPAVSYTKLNQKSARSPKKSSKNVYDVPSSEEELEFSTPMGEKTGTPRSTKRPNGSARKASDKEETAVDTADDTEEQTQGTPSRGRRPRQTLGSKVDASNSDVLSSRKPAVKNIPARAKPRQTEALENQQATGPKGILTPRHKRRGRPPKSVAFDSDDNKPAEVFFKDLPKTKTPLPKLAKPQAGSKTFQTGKSPAETVSVSGDEESQEDGESEDDEVCIICSKPDSTARNQILLCDNCDRGFHQKCYNVPVIPKDDWFCKDCLQENMEEEITEGAKDATDQSMDVPDIANFEHHLRTMQRVLIDRCSGSRRLALKGQGEAYQKTYQLVEQTVMAGEGNSMMIIGARGCGKTLMVENVISELATESSDAFHVIRLNGFIHTDDKLALKEIWRQLGKEMEVEDDLMSKTSNYADTLASLLALLSHPSEITGTDEGITSRSVVFVIDEFDLFAAHARQTLLYNLFDIAQARKAPIAVLGVTTRIDVVESLEKRVKSRFSHRYVHLSLPKSLLAYWEICKQGLQVEEDDLESEGFDVGLEGLTDFQKYWNDKIETLHKSPSFQAHLEYQYYTTKSVTEFLTTCVLPLSTLSPSALDLKIGASLSRAVQIQTPDSKLHLLAALSDLDLSMLIAAARLDIVAHTDTVNFAMAYDEYNSQMGKQRVQSATSGILALGAGGRTWGRAVAGMAWERLVSLGLLIPAGIGGRSNAAHGGLEGKMWKLDVSLEEIPTAVELPGFLAKWCTQI
ncbi:hypothetical protein PFICI_04258 [Pestalotiopsis fici W106-1]|uniref:Origin recognition complex subunit 4 n=1 Tax=Pestalotiopsis fici (strain W106-1 / CGMCC3.15140) TaxID=1229662 RepID=W3XAE9_PESFW|nr:uncharacterized protein PFICI_04258 [Pestalotiopsis fici W106-1]ETS82382.1 hypothetical protein PFICI_04258 [Pestalotiopsis fici W106-1]